MNVQWFGKQWKKDGQQKSDDEIIYVKDNVFSYDIERKVELLRVLLIKRNIQMVNFILKFVIVKMGKGLIMKLLA